MARIDRPGVGELSDIRKRLRKLETASPLNHASIGSGGLRVHSGGVINIENGGLSVTGTASVAGILTGLGQFLWNGIVTLASTFTANGPWNLNGAGTITGNSTQTGDMTVNGGGKITIAGSVPMVLGVTSLGMPGVEFSAGNALISTTSGVMMKSGTTGGRVAASASAVSMALGAKSIAIGGTQVTVSGGLVTDTLSTSGSKMFSMPHPSKPGHLIQHGSTESPVSGIEYWGDDRLDAAGKATITLPDYFESLAKPENRTVFVAGRGSAPDWTDIESAAFDVTGVPGKRFSWLVKAERRGADFSVEPLVPVTTE